MTNLSRGFAFFATMVLVSPALLAADAGNTVKTPFAVEQDEGQLRKALQELTSPPPRQPGAHRPKDPHAALSPDSMVRVALQHHEEGRPALALDTLNDALKRYPGNGDLLNIRGSLLLQQDKTAAALSDLEAAAKATPENPAIYVNRAQAYRRFKNESKAMADLDKAVELSPDFVAARFNRGSMHFSAGRYKEALVDFERCAAVDPHAPPPWFNLAMTREQLGDKEGAVSDLKRFLELTQTKEWREVAEKKLQDLAAKPKE